MVKVNKNINSSEYAALSELSEELFYKLANLVICDARHDRNLELMANACILLKATAHNLQSFVPHSTMAKNQ